MKNKKLLMIPGPIEFDSKVISAMGVQTPSHTELSFIESFGNCLRLMKKVWLAPGGQPFIVSGSGTLAMDMAISNLVEPGDKVLVISTGYFGERFKDISIRYGANVTVLTAPIGEVVFLEDIEDELKNKDYKLLTITHVDTSTAVLVNPKPIADLAKKYEVLSILDGICSVAGEEIKQDDWGLDVIITASQKAIGVPPGLALVVVSQKALNVWKKRKTLVLNYYSDWGNWLPIMKAYEEGYPAYFGTPPVNLILALETSLKIILSEGMLNRIKRHQKLASAFRLAVFSLGLKLLPINTGIAANTLSAIYYPDNTDGGLFCSKMADNNVIIAGGLHPEIKSDYFRVGHMGSVSETDLITTLNALELSLRAINYNIDLGISLDTFKKEMSCY